jgi:mannose-1-phosphate guanylyltransferase
MAGGVGSRFWPKSRMEEPKQLLKLFNENSMIQNTVDRLSKLINNENIFIITNQIQKSLISNQLKSIPSKNIIAEPFGKNTAACIGLASVIIESMDPDAVTITLPSDHLISPKSVFHKTIKTAAKYAYENSGLVTIGIPPTRPETGYGYIQLDEKSSEQDFYKVKTFAEKPNIGTANRFLKSGDFLWNSGMFIWRVDTILEEIKKLMPDLDDGLISIRKHLGKSSFDDHLSKVYGQLKNISIDYGIMEKSENVYIIKGEFNWSDAGSWEEVYNLSKKDDKGNVINGEAYLEESYDNYLLSEDKFTALVGVENLIVVNTPDALLICDRRNSQNVKHVVDYLKMKKKSELL